ncbi:MAG: 3-oxoacid CoA-transferase subunit B [Chloroflexota bacterium]|nr:3-oxoacid CoA-transferase subunit B [Chloroflexota bacterium]
MIKERLSEEVIAMRAAKEFQDGNYINLGIGVPNLCALFVSEDKTVFFESENGVLGYGPVLLEDEFENVDIRFVDAGGRFFWPKGGMSFFDMDISFDMIRGGRLDISVMGAYQVSQNGDLANYRRPNDASIGIGGSMDLAVGAKRVIVAMEHTTRDGQPRILTECTYPLTARECVDLVVTDCAVIKVTQEGLVLKEIAPGWTAGEVQEITEAKLIISEDLKEIEL